MSRRACLAAICSFALGCPPPRAVAQDFPTRNITFVVPFAAGTQSDAVARWLGSRVADQLGRQVIVENIPGANGLLGARDFIRRAPDGYSVFVSTNTTHGANPSLYRNLPYDPVRDFTPVACLFRLPLVAVVRATLPIESMADLVAYARRSPGTLTFGWASSTSRAGGELLKSLTHVDVLAVPFRSAPQIATEMLGGRIDLFVADPVNAMPHIQTGAFRALAVTSPTRMALLPDVPTMAEAGVQGYEMVGWYAAYLPVGAPPAIVARLNAAFTQAVRDPDVVRFAAQSGVEPFPCTPERLAEFTVQQIAHWRRLAEIARIEKE